MLKATRLNFGSLLIKQDKIIGGRTIQYEAKYMKAIYFFSLLGVMASCDTQQKETKKQTDPQNDTIAKSSTACYQYANQSDTVSLKLIRTGENVTGTLVYQLKEKD